MTTNNTIQEILVSTHSQFLRKEFCEKSSDSSQSSYSGSKQLQNACWSGILFELLPEILGDQPNPGSFIWEVMPARNFIRVCIAPLPVFPNGEVCIDPYFFLETKNFN